MRYGRDPLDIFGDAGGARPGYGSSSRADQRRLIDEAIYEIRRRRREREAADRDRRRIERIQLLEFLAASRRRRKILESAERRRKYVRGLVTNLEHSIGARSYVR